MAEPDTGPETGPDTGPDTGLQAAILDLALRRAATGGSFCPSEVARALEPGDWRGLMPAVRAAAAGMPEIVATQGGAVVAADAARGPIRLRLRRAGDPGPLAPGAAEE